jgi:hypothetical protein
VALVNLIFFLVGAAVMSFGIVVLANPTLAIHGLSLIPGFDSLNYIINVQQMLLSGGVVLTIVGIVVLVISFIGLLGNCYGEDAHCIFKLYSVFVLLTIFLDLALIIYSAVDNRNIESKVESYMQSALIENFEPVSISNGIISNSSSPGAAAWEALQFKYACCGAYNYTDYQKFNWQTKNPHTSYSANTTVPPSCCSQFVQFVIPETDSEFIDLAACMNSPEDKPQYMNSQGCYTVFVNKMALHGYYVVVILASLTALEIIVLIMTIFVAKSNSADSNNYI